MSDAPDAGQHGRSGQAECTPRANPLPAPDGRPADGADAVGERLRASRRARRRTRLRQAVASKRSSISAWADTVGRLWIGLVLLGVVGAVAWIEIAIVRERADLAARTAADAEATRQAAAVAAT